MITKISTILLTILTCITSPSQARTYHVAENGNDSNKGTITNPFRTITKAASILIAGDTCIVHTGVYRESIKPSDNGTSQNFIVLMAAKGDHVVITGFEPVDQWKKSNNSIYAASAEYSLSESNMVLFNGKMGFEARYPNKLKSDPFEVSGEEIIEEGVSTKEIETVENPDNILFNGFPENLISSDLKQSKVWVLTHHKWSAWTAKVDRYDNETRRLYFNPFPLDQNWVRSTHNPKLINKAYGRGLFYIFGAETLLDTAYEWYYDIKRKELKVITPSGRKPVHSEIEFRKRTVAVDLENRKYWKVSGFEIIGATINLKNAEGCIVDACSLKYFWHNIASQSQNASSGISGIEMGGSDNTIQNSELSYSAGTAISLSGKNNRIVNNLIHHTNYLGSIIYGIINASGIEHQIIYNTIHSAGRDCIKLGGGGGHQIAYNEIYNPGLICKDLGVAYSGGTDYENMEIHHNYIHNSSDQRSMLGIYFDNFTENGIAHHNIVWRIKEGVRLNRPGNYHMIYNNIVMEINNAYGPWKGSKTQYGSAVFNNFITFPLRINNEVFSANNIVGQFAFDTIGFKPLHTQIVEKIHLRLPGYVGAFDPSKNIYWKAGHDFSKTQTPLPQTEKPFMRNYVRNGSFEWRVNRNMPLSDKSKVDEWETKGTIEITNFQGFNSPGPETRSSIHGNSLRLSGKGSGISQRITELIPGQKYMTGVYVQCKEMSNVLLKVDTGDGIIHVSSNDAPTVEGWKLLELNFEAKNINKIILSIENTDNGEVFLDNIGLVPKL